MNLPIMKYVSNEYYKHNPTWDRADSPWKAKKVVEIINKKRLKPSSICEVGCGAGGVLSELRSIYPNAALCGYDIAPDASNFWHSYQNLDIDFFLGDFFKLNRRKYDLLLILDVIEHVANPYSFLSKLRFSSNYYIFHIPLDLSAINVLREKPLLKARNKVGHLHYFTKNLALSLLNESGYDIIEWWYSGATSAVFKSRWKTMLAFFPRRLAYALSKDISVRALGGETLFALTRNKT